MRSPSTTTPVIAQREDTRTDGPMTGGERAVLDHWLDLYRDTALLKLAGLDAEQLTRRAVPPSSMSLIGMVRHLTEVEAYWLRVVLPTSKTSRTTAAPRPARTVTSTTSTPQRRQLTSPRTRPRWSPPAPTPRRGPTSPYPSADCAKASRSISVGSSPTSWRSTPATSATWTLSARRSTAVPATDVSSVCAEPSSQAWRCCMVELKPARGQRRSSPRVGRRHDDVVPANQLARRRLGVGARAR